MGLTIAKGDITKVQVDAIVNAANNRLQAGGGVCGAIFEAAGRSRLQEACDEIGYCATGAAVITDGFDLPARYIIHTAGPVWQGGGRQEEELLRSCYNSALQLAVGQKLQSVAFPLISGGIYGYPKKEAIEIAISSIREFLLQHDELDVRLVLFDEESFQLGRQLMKTP